MFSLLVSALGGVSKLTEMYTLCLEQFPGLGTALVNPEVSLLLPAILIIPTSLCTTDCLHLLRVTLKFDFAPSL